MSNELEALRKRHADEEAKLIRELAIKAALPDIGVPWRVHAYALYGAVASACVEHDWFAYGKPDKVQPTLDTVRLAAGLLPPLPLVRVKDGCLSFRPKFHVDAIPEEKKERWDEELEVSPFLVQLDAFQHQSAEVEWFSRLTTGDVIRVEVKIPLPDVVGRFDIRRKRGPHGAEQPIESCSFQPNTERLTTLFDGGEPVAQLESPIRWASGSPTTPNKFTLFWVELRADAKPTSAAALVEALTKTK